MLNLCSQGAISFLNVPTYLLLLHKQLNIYFQVHETSKNLPHMWDMIIMVFWLKK